MAWNVTRISGVLGQGIRPGETPQFCNHEDVFLRSMIGCLRRPSVDRVSVAVALLWSIAVGLALAATLSSLRSSGYDGLNNMLQIPFALPWIIIPIGGSGSHEADAWIAAAMGWVNAALILLFLPEYRRLRALPPPPSN